MNLIFIMDDSDILSAFEQVQVQIDLFTLIQLQNNNNKE